MRIPRRPPLTHGLQAWKCTAAAFKPGSQLGSSVLPQAWAWWKHANDVYFLLVSRTRRHFPLCRSLV